MKKYFNYLVLFIFTTTIIISCSSDDDSTPPVNETPKSEAKQLTSFVFNANNNDALEENTTAVINEADKTIVATVPYGTSITALTPTIEISDKATVNPTGAQDFSSLVDYTVTAEDGAEVVYEVSVTITPNDAKQITSFQFLAAENEALIEDIVAEIDEENKTIIATVPYDTGISTLLPTIEVSAGATITPEGVQDFTDSVMYTVTAEDGTTEIYEIEVIITPITETEVLIAIYNANPDNTLGWDIDNPDISTWNGVIVNENGNVIELILGGDIGYDLISIPKEIGSLINLTKLWLGNNNLETIPVEMYNLTNLTELYLERNELGTISSRMGDLFGLTVLDLGWNNLNSISFEIGNLTNLTYLSLRGNNIEIVPEQIGDLVNLTEIHLSSNNIEVIPEQIGNLTNLIKMNLGDNKIISLPGQIGDLINLTELRLGFNNLKILPEQIGDLINLNILDLNTNNLEIVHEQIGNLVSLTNLNLSFNNLEGLPVEIGNLTNLTFLDLSNNELETLPEEIGNLINLTLFFLRNNNLETIPQAVCSLEDTGTNIIEDIGVTCGPIESAE